MKLSQSTNVERYCNSPDTSRKQYCSGVSLIEVILALALFSVIAVSIFGTEWRIRDLFVSNARSFVANNAAHIALFDFLNGNASSTEPTLKPFDVFSHVHVGPFTICENSFDVLSTWRTDWGTHATSSTSFLSVDLRLADQYGKDCGGHPARFSDSTFAELATVELGTLATSVDIVRGQAFISLKSATDPDPDIAVVPLVSPFTPLLLDSGKGINKIDAVDGYIFAAQNSSTSQLAIFGTNISPPNPLLIATSTLPGVAGVRPEAVSIFYFDKKVYVGTKRTAGNEFHIFDVSVPNSPRWLGSKEVNHNINDIVVKDGYAFLATSGNIRDLIVLDVRNPAAILQVAAVDLLGNEDGRSIQVVGNTIYLGKYKATVPGHDELCVLSYDFDSTGTIQIHQLYTVPTSGDINSIVKVGGAIFAATNNPLKDTQIFNTDDFERPSPTAFRDIPAAATGIDFENNIFTLTFGTKVTVYAQQ